VIDFVRRQERRLEERRGAAGGGRRTAERLCRYTLRPPLALTWLRVDADGQVCLALRHQLRFSALPKR
jgi:hypothetical protein